MIAKQILALTWKDWKLLAADRASLIILFVLPTLFLFVMSLALQGLYDRTTPPLAIVVNLDRGPLAGRVIEQISVGGAVRLVSETSKERAKARIREREALSAIVFAADFSETVEAQANDPKRAVSMTVIDDPAAPLQVTAPIRGAVRGAAERAVAEAIVPMQLRARMEAFIRETGDLSVLPLADSFRNLQVGAVRISSETMNSKPERKQPGSVEQNVPAWTIFGIFFIVNTIALSLLRERQSGTLLRLQAAPLSPVVLLLGKLLPFYCINLLQAALMFALGHWGLQLRLGAHPAALIAITLAVALVATSLGLLLATCFASTEQLGSTASVLVVVLAALGGILVPSFVMPDFMQTLALFTPQAWALEGYQNVLLRGQDLLGVLPQVGVLLAFAGGLFAVAVWRLGRLLVR